MSKAYANISSLLLAAVMVSAGFFVPGVWAWVITAVCMIVFLLVLGQLISRRPLGVLVNQRNLMSLSRFQMVLWTITLLSAYFTIGMARIAAGVSNPLAVEIDWQLWTLMGIGATSFVAGPLINSTKTNKTPPASEVTKAANMLVTTSNVPASCGGATTPLAAPVVAPGSAAGGQPGAAPPAAPAAPVALPAAPVSPVSQVKSAIEQASVGTLYGNPTIADASFADMFEGDEIGNTAYVDLAKVQMFFFTVVVVIAYIAALVSLMAKLKTDPASVTKFPPIHESLLALLGISHAGFLTSKSVDKTKTQ